MGGGADEDSASFFSIPAQIAFPQSQPSKIAKPQSRQLKIHSNSLPTVTPDQLLHFF
jgi:hypothetical protein